MAHSEDVRSWAAREQLPPQVTQVLQEQGINSTDQIRGKISPDDVIPMFLNSGLLNMAQSLALKSAISNLSATPGSGAPVNPPAPTQQQHHPSYPPAYNAPGAYASHPFPAAAQPHPSAQGLLYNTPPHHGGHYYPNPGQPHPSAGTPIGQFFPAPGGQPHPSAYPAGYRFPPQPYPATPHPFYPAMQPNVPVPTSVDISGISAALAATSIHRDEMHRFLLMGKCGSGKSTSGNTILGEKQFRTGLQFAAVTDACERKLGYHRSRKFQIMDCPGLYDPHKTNEEIGIAIVQAVAGMHPGPNAILYVISIGRYTEEEYGTYQRLKSLFDESITQHMIVLFTGGDRLEQENKSIQQLIDHDSTKELQLVLKDCNNRYVVFNNMAHDKQPQVERLFSVVNGMVAENNHRPYTCPKYSAIGQGLEEEVTRRLEKVEEEDLKRKEYVMKLEQRANQAEIAALETIRRSEENEQERQRKMKAEEAKNQKIRDELQAQWEEQLERARKHEEELQRLLKEREDQERRVKEKEHEMTEKERQRAAEEVERMRQRELDMQQRLAEERQRMAAQQKEDEDRRRALEKDMQDFKQTMEEQRRKEDDEVKAAAEEREKALNEKLDEERVHRENMERAHREEMERIQTQIAEDGKNSIYRILGKGIITLVCAGAGAYFGGPGGAAAGFTVGENVVSTMFNG